MRSNQALEPTPVSALSRAFRFPRGRALMRSRRAAQRQRWADKVRSSREATSTHAFSVIEMLLVGGPFHNLRAFRDPRAAPMASRNQASKASATAGTWRAGPRRPWETPSRQTATGRHRGARTRQGCALVSSHFWILPSRFVFTFTNLEPNLNTNGEARIQKFEHRDHS